MRAFVKRMLTLVRSLALVLVWQCPLIQLPESSLLIRILLYVLMPDMFSLYVEE